MPAVLAEGGSKEHMNPHPYTDGDPIIHSDHTDVLDEEHPWAYCDIFCATCSNMLHADNNECMRPWIEWQKVALCAKCAAQFLTELTNVGCFLDDNCKPKSMKGKIRW